MSNFPLAIQTPHTHIKHMTHDYHNPDNLIAEQVGEGYRLLLKSELIGGRGYIYEIEIWLPETGVWDASGWTGSDLNKTYRVPLATWPLPEETAWTLGNSVNGFTLSEGQQWHRLDWTREMLPEGWRPHIDGEAIEEGDEWLSHAGWRKFTLIGGTISSEFCKHYRTRRPLPTPEIPWIPWHGGECPLKDDELREWEVKFRDGATPAVSKPSNFRWEHINTVGDIIAYRVLKWKKPPVKEPSYNAQPSGGAWPGHPVSKQQPTDNEPWCPQSPPHPIAKDKGVYWLNPEQFNRACACVNACAGIEDPEESIPAAFLRIIELEHDLSVACAEVEGFVDLLNHKIKQMREP